RRRRRRGATNANARTSTTKTMTMIAKAMTRNDPTHPPHGSAWEHWLMLGDRVEVLVDVGDGVRSFDIAATKAGRRVEVSTSRGTVEVSEVTRTGKAGR